MSADFWAGYASGVIGICVGNPLDIWKVQLQAGWHNAHVVSSLNPIDFRQIATLLKGVAAPALAYGALNSLLYMTYNRSLRLLEASISDPTKLSKVALWKIGAAGAAGGLATWVISAPSELVKCRAQLQTKSGANSLTVFKEIWTEGRMRAIYHGGLVTSTRDAIGYAFYFSSYEVCKRLLSNDKMDQELQCTDTDVLLSGGIAGVTTWASIYPLDVIKTRIQTADLKRSPHIISLTRTVYRTERPQAFFRGLTVCSIRAFIVNAIQWFVYEKTMAILTPKQQVGIFQDLH